MDCGSVLVKYILFLFNLLCGICGILLIIFGGMVLAHLGDVKACSMQIVMPVVALVLGICILILSFIGCCGAARASNGITLAYSLFLLALLIAQIVFVSMVWINQKMILEEFEEMFTEVFNNREKEPETLDYFQRAFKCCGNNGPYDYFKQSYRRSCCAENKLVNNECDIQYAYTTGCKQAFRRFWKSNIELIKFAGLGVAIVELVGVIFSCIMANNIRSGNRRKAGKPPKINIVMASH
ncbi:CD63.2 family protein [Megaselia abdita]